MVRQLLFGKDLRAQWAPVASEIQIMRSFYGHLPEVFGRSSGQLRL
jgi:hypothetical protein